MTTQSEPPPAFRTFIIGTLIQQSAYTGGGSGERLGGPDLQCACDGSGQLTLAGRGLAGAMIETAGRLYPPLFAPDPDRSRKWWGRVTGKARGTNADGQELAESVWRFVPAHLNDANAHPRELRQGVGLRHATGASAREGRVLFDSETIPAGARWRFHLEIDSLRGSPKADGLALMCLAEWKRERCWLGAGPARGLGWMKLEQVEVVRLPLSVEADALWPDNRVATFHEKWTAFKAVKSAESLVNPTVDALHAWGESLFGEPLPQHRFCYVTLDANFAPGPHSVPDPKSEQGDAQVEYGWDGLSVGGHGAGLRDHMPLLPDNLNEHCGWLRPLGQSQGAFLADYNTDLPIVTTRGHATGPLNEPRPFVSGGGVRGPLRHRGAAFWNGKNEPQQAARDPNIHPDGATTAAENSEELSPFDKLFGTVQLSSRLLVRDARLEDPQNLLVAWFQHHAADEFTGGVYGSAKFDRTVLLRGEFTVRLVVEAESEEELREHIAALRPALRLAELGFVPLGRAKNAGLGWVPWRFFNVSLARAGENGDSILGPDQPTETSRSPQQLNVETCLTEVGKKLEEWVVVQQSLDAKKTAASLHAKEAQS